MGSHWSKLVLLMCLYQTVFMCTSSPQLFPSMKKRTVFWPLRWKTWTWPEQKLHMACFRAFIWNEKTVLFSPFTHFSCTSVRHKTTCFTQLSLPQGTVRQFGSVKTLIHWARWFKAFGGPRVSPRGLEKLHDFFSWYLAVCAALLKVAETKKILLLLSLNGRLVEIRFPSKAGV